ncbi:MAG: MogA/MoaB family molybdenum cofactor biosynthesis protein [Thermodesulfobacteriota bacterium]
MGVTEHRRQAVQGLKIGIITMSTTRTPAEDESGHWMAEKAEKEGHTVVAHRVIPDEAGIIRETVNELIQAFSPRVLLMNGGTGASPKDVTIEAVKPLFQKELTGFGILFAQLSYAEIGSAAILSRATAGVIGNTAVFCMPGSIKACRLACGELIFPDLGHLAKHLQEG